MVSVLGIVLEALLGDDHISRGLMTTPCGDGLDQALGDLDEAIGPALAMRRNQRDLAGTVYYDAAFYTGNNLARLPEALRPKPGRLTNGQQRVYEVKAPPLMQFSRFLSVN
jgi:hypothetical protein